ncbi:cytochrome P450 [Armillaria gallica]|uniref:Cytochrome P450 n=1 Tax=Armillaria gallica TaxID=47427 RepID=A0A2H3D5U7_ARMGA|nr:cytochrome P450 [Armillaria gallica]
MVLQDYIDLAREGYKTFVLRTLGIAAVFLLALQLRKALDTKAKLKYIPTVGSSGIITSWIDAFKFVFYAKEIIQEGYVKHYGSTFRVPLIDKWIIVVSGAEKIEDIRKSSREQLSVMDAVNDLLQMDHTMGRCIAADPYHIDVIRGVLTRNIVTYFADVHDEIKAAFRENIPMFEEWTSVPLFETIPQIVCRASNRMFVGLPVCRDRDYIRLNIDFTQSVFLCACLINHVPALLKSILGTIFSPRNGALAKTKKFLGSMIRERLQQESVHGKYWPDKPSDFLSWCLDACNENETRRTIPDLSTRLLAVNMAAIHTVSKAFTTALYALAAHPEYVQTLRSEVESIIEEEGCTKVAMGKMTRLDSFMMEAQRVYGSNGLRCAVSLGRTIFSDGTVVPAGSYIVVPAFSTNMDEMVSPGVDFMFFGYGRHQWHVQRQIYLCTFKEGSLESHSPGRFLAVIELKIMLSHVLLNFDVKMDKVPPPICISQFSFIGKGKVLFRKRVRTPQR